MRLDDILRAIAEAAERATAFANLVKATAEALGPEESARVVRPLEFCDDYGNTVEKDLADTAKIVA